MTFSAQDLKKILNARGAAVTLNPLTNLTHTPTGTYIVIARDDASNKYKLALAGGRTVGTQKEQDFALRVTKTSNRLGYWILGGDRVGAMYGGIHLGELVKAGLFTAAKDEDLAYLGLYYANKIRGAVDLARYRK